MTSMTEPGAIDCDVHPTRAGHHGAAALSRRRSGATRSVDRAASTRWSPSAIRRNRRSPRGRNGAARTATRRPTPKAARARRCSTAGRPGLPSSIVSTACSFCSARTWRRRSAARSTTTSPRNGSTAIRGMRASIVIPMQNVEYAVDEIERCAKDKRFVQVLVLAMQEVPLGRRHFWPIYAACERHGLPLGIHAGSAYRNPVTVARLADLVHRGLCRPVAGLPVAGRKPDHRGRVRQASPS